MTPFKQDQSIDEKALRHLVELQVEAKVTGIVPVGTTGESPTTTAEEDFRIYKICVEQARKRIKVMCGTGSNCTREAVEHTKNAQKAGADCVLIVCPYYNKPTQEGLFLHYTEIAKNTKIPIFIYNIKGRTAVNMETETLKRLSENPKIIGVKEASGDLSQMKNVIKETPDEFTVLSGDDGLTLELIKLGGDGVISVASNVLPKQITDFVNNSLNTNFKKAEKQNEYFKEIFKNLFIETNPIPVKYCLYRLKLCKLIYRLPLCPPNLNSQKILDQTLTAYNLT
ncbi:4-hydroxy-tetrahydrodipicolinate synthase [Candidatus Peregrinibacteria bacterium RIFOXYA2_FULL_33_7]|nr:MAG: 4-hydroxy-tetrahydrodipicolinate synthase [Candidatus Peregrinibacteria bacterium RIFOXYA2_FULL_33_7]